MSKALTRGVHHIGLTVPDLDASVAFFIDLLGWSVAGSNAEYPAVFVTDGKVMITLWRTKTPGASIPFDKDNNIGLHHLALSVADIDVLNALHTKLANAGITIEFAPEPLQSGPIIHMMCFEPGGNRIEFIVPV